MRFHPLDCVASGDRFHCTCTNCGWSVHMRSSRGGHLCEPIKMGTLARVQGLLSGKPGAGPGGQLKALLASLGVHSSPTCKCNKMASQMDSWGPDESLRHIEEIVDVMQETARARKLPFLRAVGRKLVRIACARARKKAAPAGH